MVVAARSNKDLVGLLVNVHELVPKGRPAYGYLSNAEDVWHVSAGSRHWLHSDARLRPIRDPGDDAKDETLSWLPVPSTEKEAA